MPGIKLKAFSIGRVLNILKKEFDKNKTPIIDLMSAQGDSPERILTGTILSARTKDETTANAVQRLFARIKKLSDLSNLSQKEIAAIIYPVGFYRQKAAQLKKLPLVLAKEFDGRIPQTIEDMCRLPGVGRKTANLVLAQAFGIPAICVDVHVHRISNRWGYIRTMDVLETEMALRDKLPKKYWILYNSVVVSFGQHTCRPMSPHCDECPVKGYCPMIGVKK